MKQEPLSERGNSMFESCIFSSGCVAECKFFDSLDFTVLSLSQFEHCRQNEPCDDGGVPNSPGDKLASGVFGQSPFG